MQVYYVNMQDIDYYLNNKMFSFVIYSGYESSDIAEKIFQIK